MEFVGRTLKKEFEGIGVFTGVVKSYDSSSEVFEIGYEDRDSEEIGFSELVELLEVDGIDALSEPSSRVAGRPKKKRRRVFGSLNSGNENDFESCLDNAVDVELRNEAIIVENLSSNDDKNNIHSSCNDANLKDGGLDLDGNVNGNVDGIDLNMDLDLNEENRLESEKGGDLVDDSVKEERCFDLNMDLDHVDDKNQDVDLHGESQKKEDTGGEVVETKIEEDAALNGSHLEVSGDIVVESPEPLGANSVNNQNSPVFDDQNGTLGKTYPGRRRGRKRRKLLDSPSTPTESVLRRSARRRAKISSEVQDSNAAKYDVTDSALAASPVVSAVSEDQPTISGCEEIEEPSILPQKLELPPSTGNMNLDGLPVLDLFSVYSFLRSFSTILFLSPFELGDFVASIRSKSPSLLIDSIHVSLLRNLRKHLEFQSSESSTSATNCLRDLNWNLLDLITWPIFMAEYLLMKPDFDLARLKLIKTDYYEQPEFVKVEMLQYICDDVIEGEAISSELNRRTLVGGEPTIIMESDQNTTLVSSKKRRATMAISGSSCMSEEAVDETTDWNSDECCLCKMDGNLICCDGCPAAFHSKCVGIATNLLPEGDWFCPECRVDKNNPGMNVAKAIRGADLLGVDPHGRLFYSSCGYVLVSDVCDAETSIHYYHMNDLTALISALNLLNGPYRAISNAITKRWNLYKKCYGAKTKMDSENAALCADPPLKTNMADTLETCAKETLTEEQPGEDGSNLKAKLDSLNVEQRKNVDSSNNGYNLSKTTTRKGTSQPLETGYLNVYSFARVASSVAREWTRKPSSDKVSQTPTKSLEELISAQMKTISKTSVDFCWSNIQNLSVDARKEKCGWCLACKFPTDDGSCLFTVNNTDALGSYASNMLGFGSSISRKDRLVDVMCHILCIEDRLHGLLLGPWLNPHFPKVYRKRFHEATSITPVKNLLLMLESNIRLRALSDEWLKHVDSVVTVGSASHIMTSKLRIASRSVTGKKRSRLDTEPHSSKNASSGLGLFWWRGGRLTRKLFSWKVLPRSLACKAARQGGGKKIDGILYPENSEFPKRSKVLAWRASVETATSVEHLALQVREFDSNIRWEEIENTTHLAKMDKESIKSMRSFKKAIIRRKSSEGTVVKYLLDFGKRRFIPDTVVKHGSKIEDLSSGRKKYWLEEPYVPLFLLKTFEDRRIASKSNKTSPGSLSVNKRMRITSKRVGFSYLFARAEKAENHRCGHCNKDVPIRDAVSCQYCEGFFHKRHVKKMSGGLTEECTYTCHKCHAGETPKIAPKKGKLRSWKAKKASNIKKPVQSKTAKKARKGKQSQAKGKSVIVPLRRSARTAKIVSLQPKKKQKKKQPKKKKQAKKSADKKQQLNSAVDVIKPKGKRGRPRKIRKESFQKKRSQVQTTYWLRGLLLSRKPDDERVNGFRTRNHLVAFDQLTSVTNHQPKCCLCHEPKFRSSLNYINCETCGEWYHGDAFGLQDEHIGVIIGFKCHKCRERAPPVCPLLTDTVIDESKPKNDEVSSEVVLKEKPDTIEEPKDPLIDDPETESISKDVFQSSLTDSKAVVENGSESPLKDSISKDFSETGSDVVVKSVKEPSGVQREANADGGELVVDKVVV